MHWISIAVIASIAILFVWLLQPGCGCKPKTTEGYADPIFMSQDRLDQLSEFTNGHIGCGILSGYPAMPKAY